MQIIKNGVFCLVLSLISIGNTSLNTILAQTISQNPQTLAELRTKIDQILAKPELSTAQIGITVSSLENGDVLFSNNGDKLYMPASTTKIYTIAAIFDKLTPNFRFRTSIYAHNNPENGVLKDDLTIYGRGDPSFSANFYNGDYLKAIDNLAINIANSGLKLIEGDLIGDESYFNGPKLGFGWSWDDLSYDYAAPVSALSSNDNALDVIVKAGGDVGTAGVVSINPTTSIIKIINKTTTGAAGSKRNVVADRALGQNVIEISGNVPLDDTSNGFVRSVSVNDPVFVFIDLLKEALLRHGIEVKGKLRVVSHRDESIVNQKPIELAFSESLPLSTIATQAMKMSENLYAEIFLRTLGEISRTADTKLDSIDAGLEAVQNFLKTAKVANTSMLVDGSGLSRYGLTTTNSMVQVLRYMGQHPFSQAFYETFPIAGVDGTLKGRFKGTVAEKNVVAKTGSLSQVATLAGYVTTKTGEKLAFAIFINNHIAGSSARRNVIDEIVTLLASFDGNFN